MLKNVNLGGHRHLIIDVALNHEFGGNHMADVTRNGALRAADPAKLLEATARTKIGACGSRQAFGQGVETTGTLPVTPRHFPEGFVGMPDGFVGSPQISLRALAISRGLCHPDW